MLLIPDHVVRDDCPARRGRRAAAADRGPGRRGRQPRGATARKQTKGAWVCRRGGPGRTSVRVLFVHLNAALRWRACAAQRTLGNERAVRHEGAAGLCRVAVLRWDVQRRETPVQRPDISANQVRGAVVAGVAVPLPPRRRAVVGPGIATTPPRRAQGAAATRDCPSAAAMGDCQEAALTCSLAPSLELLSCWGRV